MSPTSMLYKAYDLPNLDANIFTMAHSDLIQALLLQGEQTSDPELLSELAAIIELRLPTIPHCDDWNHLAKLLSTLGLGHLGGDAQPTLAAMIDHYKQRFQPAKLETVGRALNHKPMTKKAVYAVWRAEDIDRDAGSACLVYLWFRRKQNELHCHAHMRACDIFRKFLADILLFTSVHQSLADTQGLERGKMCIFVDSAHLYIDDEDAITRYLQKEARA